ncbi:MAG: discoidin domain-containing protein [Colwellia sp.]
MKFMNKQLGLTKITLLCSVFLCSAFFGIQSHATNYNDPFWAQPNNNADFIDHFDGASINREAWKVETDIFVNGEDIDYQDVEYPQADWTIGTGQNDSDALDGKALILKARYMDGIVQDVYGGDTANPGKPLYIRSGRIETQITDDTTFTYGKFEARIKNPPARNAEFPAWWLLGNFPDVGWTACQELDIMEFTGNNGSAIPQTHWTAPYAVHGSQQVNLVELGINNSSTEYVTYGIIKTPEKVEWYINGILTKTFSRENQGDDQPWPYVTPMRMILNHAITHVEWPDVGNYNGYSADANVANATGWSYEDDAGVTQYEYLDVAQMNTNIGRQGTDFVVDYVAHWPLPTSDVSQKYVDDTKSSFFRESGNTKGFYNLKGWLAPTAVTADGYEQPGWDTDHRDNGPDNAADGYVGSKWATPNDDNIHWVNIDYGTDKLIKYLWIEWSWNLPKSYDIYGKSSTGNWEFVLTSDQTDATWATHTFELNKAYRNLKVVTKGRIDKSVPIWLLEFKAFEDVVDVYPMPAGTPVLDRSVNLLSNGSFDNGLNDWGTEAFEGADPSYNVVNQEAVINLTNDGGNAGSVQMHASNFSLHKETHYQISFDARASGARTMQLRLSENALNPSVAGTYLLEDIDLTTTMTTYNYNLAHSVQGGAARLAFLLGDMGTDSVIIDNVVVKEGEYFGSGETLVSAIAPNNFVSASAGWENEWWGFANRAIDGVLGNKASGNDNESEGMDLDLSVRIDPHYEIKEVWVAGDNSPERSLAQFKVEYGNGALLMDWTASTTEGAYESFTLFNTVPAVGERDFTFYFRPPAGQLVEVADVQLMAIDHMPYRIQSIMLDDGGEIIPSGTIRYNKNNTDSATYNFVAQTGQSVSNVIIDGVSLGAITSYTFDNISSNHSIAVAFTGSGVVTPPETENLALNAVVTASTGFAEFATDNNIATRWESDHGAGPSSISLDLNVVTSLSKVVIHWEAANAEIYSVEGSVDGNNWTTLSNQQGGTFGNRTDEITVSGDFRFVKVTGTKRSVGNLWGYSIFELEVYGDETTLEAENLALNSIVSASTGFAELAIDNNIDTRWESDHGEGPSSISIDLNSIATLSKVVIHWEAANAEDYSIEGSIDGNNWTVISNQQAGIFGNRTDEITIAGDFRFIRVTGTKRSVGNLWGYSIFELEIHGFYN